MARYKRVAISLFAVTVISVVLHLFFRNVTQLPYWALFLKTFFLLSLIFFGIQTWYDYKQVVGSVKRNATEMERVHSELSKFNELLHSVQVLIRDINQVNTVDDFNVMPDMINEKLMFDFCQLWIIRGDTGELQCFGSSPIETEPRGIPAFYRKYAGKKHITVLQKTDDQNILELLQKTNLNTLILCPLVKDDFELGMLLVGNTKDSIIQEQIFLLQSVTNAVSGTVARDELIRIQEKDRSLLESISDYTCDTVARVKLYEKTQNSLQEKTRELRRVLSKLGRARAKVLKNIRMSVFNKNSLLMIKEMNSHFFSLSVEANNLSRLYHALFIIEQRRIADKLVLKESDFGDVFGEITFLFEKTVVELQRCIRITAGMNNYAKKNQEEIIEKKNLLDVARNAIELISPDIWNGVDINIDRNESMIWSVNEEDMENVFYNLFMNSLEAMNGKGRLKVTGYKKHEDLRVIIRDNGPGISRSFLNRVFEPFFTTKECGQKSGMGLTLSSDLVKKFGGDLEIMSNPGKGTTALITFTRSYFPH